MSLDAPLAEHEQLVEGLGPFRLVRDHEHAGAAAAGGGDELGEERPGAGRVEVSDGLVQDEEAAPASIGRLIFQGGHGAGIFGFESQGFLDAWAPVFFFAMIFAISMDYTVFLLASAKEHFDQSGDPREAAVGGLAHSGRVIFAAAAVMVAVFFTFALSGPLPPKEMGVILGIAVLLDALLVRLVLIPTPWGA